MSEKITKISDANFDSSVIIPKKPALVFFSANWSGSSRMIRPTIESAAEKYSGKAAFFELDMDENPATPMTYGVRTAPTILLFAGGQLANMHVGTISRDKLNEKLEKITASGEALKKAAARFGR